MTSSEKAKRPGTGTATTAKQTYDGATARPASARPTAAVSSHRDVPGALTPAQIAAAPVPNRESPVAMKKLTYEERMRALAPIVQVRRKVESTIKRFGALADDIKRWKNAPDLRAAASSVEMALAGLLAEATTTADTFAPEKERKSGAKHLEPGVKVALRDKFIARYEGVLDPAERATLEVVTTTRGHVSVKTVAGARIVLPRAHVARATDAG